MLTYFQGINNCETRKRGNIDFLDAQEEITLWSLTLRLIQAFMCHHYLQVWKGFDQA